MVVLADGQTLGTIGGGCVEAEVRSKALRLLAGVTDTQLAQLFTFKLDHDFGWDDGLVCGGTMTVAVQRINTAGEATAFTTVAEALRQDRMGTLVIDTVDAEGQPARFAHSIEPTPTLLIAGAGHVGSALAAIARQIGFAAVVVDDRPDLTTPALLAGAKCIVGPIDQELASFPIDANTYVVIVTRGHRNDGLALAAVVGSAARYIGLIGSKRKIVTIYEDLKAQGVALELLRRVHAPIGLDIGAITPAEIAVSIAAELIAVRRGAVESARVMRLPAAMVDRMGESDAV